ncbi:MAG: threonine aldolase family protein [Geminicoccaceae bacterium]
MADPEPLAGSTNRLIDLGSDTKTRPTEGMRKAMAMAEVGDEQAFEDPTVNALCERAAALLGKEAALFLPSGTMANQIAFRLHCRQGDEVLLEASSHPIHFESGGPAAVAGIMLRPIEGERGLFTAAQAATMIRGAFRHNPRTRLISLENTANMGGGTVWPLAQTEEIAELARSHEIAMHLDGARLMNAVVASDTSAAAYGACFDSLWIDFSKGLGAPVGACLAGNADFIHEAWRVKQQMGGAMRQAGIIAAAALYALDHHVDRLADDHDNAKRLAIGLAELPGVRLNPETVETNLVFLDVTQTERSASELAQALLAEGVRIGAMGPGLMRAATHLDVDGDDIDRAIEAFSQVLAA